MKEKKKFLAMILSVVICLTSVSPAFAAEFFSGEDGDSAIVQEQTVSDALEEENGNSAADLSESGAVFSEKDQYENPVQEHPEEQDAAILSEPSAEEENGSALFTDPEEIEAEDEPLFGDGSTDGQAEDGVLLSSSKELTNVDGLTGIVSQLGKTSLSEFTEDEGEDLFTASSGSLTEAQINADAGKIVEAADALREAMVKRTKTKNFNLKLNVVAETEEDLNDVMDLILGVALGETGVSYEGDYLNWSTLSTNMNIEYDGTYYRIRYQFRYSSTYAQEQEVAKAVDAALKNMKFTSATTPYMKIKTIYDYICKTVSYDNEHLYDDSYELKYSAYAAIINKKAVCQGYSLLLYRMLIEAGIDNRMVPSENHIWNIIYLRGYYYNADATWDEGTSSDNHRFFLKGNNTFSVDEDHQREEYYNSAEFKKAYPTSASDYKVQAGDTPSEGKCTHSWNAWEVIVQATCTADGVKVRVCGKCSGEEYEKIAKGHKWKYTSQKNNTHTAKCSVCKASAKAKDCTFKDNVCTKCKAQRIPEAVKISSIKSAGYNKLKLTWNKVEGAAGYQVWYLKGKQWRAVKKVAGTTYTHTSTADYPVKTGTTYYFRVRAYCTVNNKTTYGAYSAKTGGKSVAAKPEIVSVKANAYNKITVTWKKAAGATDYRIYRKNGSKWELIATVEGANSTTYTHTSSKNYPIDVGTSYTYTVRSYTKAGNTYGLYDKAGKSAKTSLSKPSLTVSRTSKGLKSTWKKVNGATGYQIQRYAGGKWSVLKTVNAKTLSYVDTTAKKGASYQYRMRAYRTSNGKRVYGGYSSVRVAKR